MVTRFPAPFWHDRDGGPFIGSASAVLTRDPESGWVNTAPGRVIRIKPDWTMSVVASEGLRDPVTGLLVKDGQVFVSHRGKVSVVQSDGTERRTAIQTGQVGDTTTEITGGLRAGERVLLPQPPPPQGNLE